MKRVILHIGTGKTGTSSIQDTLGANKKLLLRHDIYYPQNIANNHIFTFPPIFLDNPAEAIPLKKLGIKEKKEVDKKCNELKKTWIDEFDNCNSSNFILSAEDLSLSSFNKNAIERMKQFLLEYFDSITVIAYVRHFNGLISSQIQQMMKNGHPSLSFEQSIDHFIGNDKSDIFYTNNLKNWLEAFPKEDIIIRPFDQAVFKKNSLVYDFLFALDLQMPAMRITEVLSNEALGKSTIAFLEKYNQEYPVFINGKRNRKRGLSLKSIPVLLFARCSDEKFNVEIHYTQEQAKKLNYEIDFVNQLFEDGYSFAQVQSDSIVTSFPSPDDIPISFFVELINNYNKRLENLYNSIEGLEADKKKLLSDSSFSSNARDNLYKKLLNAYKKCGNSKRIIFKNLLLYAKHKKSGLEGFDKAYYKEKYPYCIDRAKDPLLHFLVRGAYLGYTPNPSFDTKEYILNNPQLVSGGENCLVHYNRKKKNK